MKLSWNIGDTVEVLEENGAPIPIGSRGRIHDLCDDNTEEPYYGVNFTEHSKYTWYYEEQHLKLISKAEEI